MFASPVAVDVAVKQLSEAVDALLAVDLTSASRDELLELARGLETQRRRLPVTDHALIGELESRAVAGQLGCVSTPALLMQLLRLTPAEARARVRAAADLGARRTLTGEQLDPIFPAVAAAQAAGQISDRHAAVIRHTVHALPAATVDREAEPSRWRRRSPGTRCGWTRTSWAKRPVGCWPAWTRTAPCPTSGTTSGSGTAR